MIEREIEGEREVYFVALSDVGAVVEEHFDGLDVALLAGDDEGRRTVLCECEESEGKILERAGNKGKKRT